MSVTNVAANRLHNSASDACSAAERRRNAFKEEATAHRAQSLGYEEGKAIAYSNAAEIMHAELRRLMNRFQNGALTLSDFGIDP